MKKTVLLFFSIFLILLSSCNDSDDTNQIVCTLEAKAGLNVTVSLDAMSSITGEGIIVVATDGAYQETLSVVNPNDPIFSGALERQGTYVITVSKDGYQTFTSAPITVTADVCHVIPQQVHVVLQAN
jgi:hypothetical protein